MSGKTITVVETEELYEDENLSPDYMGHVGMEEVKQLSSFFMDSMWGTGTNDLRSQVFDDSYHARILALLRREQCEGFDPIRQIVGAWLLLDGAAYNLETGSPEERTSLPAGTKKVLHDCCRRAIVCLEAMED